MDHRPKTFRPLALGGLAVSTAFAIFNLNQSGLKPVAAQQVANQPVIIQPGKPAPAKSAAQTASTANTNGQVEVTFVLDTTGSMAGLIDGAKRNIWSIVNEIATAKPAPTVKIGFVAYRDRGDQYVTQVHDLTADLDRAFATLSKFEAGGGGDLPEHVNKALADGVREINWTDPKKFGSSLYQVIFLVGDCPPHMDYDDGFTYKKEVGAAIARGIMVNAVRCGENEETGAIWQEIARLGEGRYFSIAQEGGMNAIETPFDHDIGLIADEIETTTVARGGAAGRTAQSASFAANAALPASSKAERAQFNSKSAQVYGKWDITTGVLNGTLKLKDVKEDELPEELKKLTPAEREKYVADKVEKRRQSQTKLDELQRKRQDYIQEYMKKNDLNDKDAFDTLVKETIKAQASKRKIKY